MSLRTALLHMSWVLKQSGTNLNELSCFTHLSVIILKDISKLCTNYAFKASNQLFICIHQLGYNNMFLQIVVC